MPVGALGGSSKQGQRGKMQQALAGNRLDSAAALHTSYTQSGVDALWVHSQRAKPTLQH